MNSWASFFLLLLVILAAIRRSQQAVRLYFWAQLVYTLVVFLGVKMLGDHDIIYAIMYGVVTLPIFECCCFLIWEARISQKLLIISVDYGLLMGIIAAIGIYRHPLADYVTFGEGIMLSILGMALALSVPTSRDALAVRTISALSFALACYDFAYLRNEDWSKLNDWLPSAMCTLAFGWIVLRRWNSGSMTQEVSHGL